MQSRRALGLYITEHPCNFCLYHAITQCMSLRPTAYRSCLLKYICRDIGLCMLLLLHIIYFIYAGCDALPNPNNGTVRWTGLTNGSFAIYSCDSGYQLSAELQIRTCRNGIWSGEAPTCLRMKNAFVMCTHLYKLKKSSNLP